MPVFKDPTDKQSVALSRASFLSLLFLAKVEQMAIALKYSSDYLLEAPHIVSRMCLLANVLDF